MNHELNEDEFEAYLGQLSEPQRRSLRVSMLRQERRRMDGPSEYQAQVEERLIELSGVPAELHAADKLHLLTDDQLARVAEAHDHDAWGAGFPRPSTGTQRHGYVAGKCPSCGERMPHDSTGREIDDQGSPFQWMRCRVCKTSTKVYFVPDCFQENYERPETDDGTGGIE